MQNSFAIELRKGWECVTSTVCIWQRRYEQRQVQQVQQVQPGRQERRAQ